MVRRIDLKKANVARSNTIRDINRQIVLNYVRELGPISRAAIARETAMQRSTVSLIVDELRADGMIDVAQVALRLAPLHGASPTAPNEREARRLSRPRRFRHRLLSAALHEPHAAL